MTTSSSVQSTLNYRLLVAIVLLVALMIGIILLLPRLYTPDDTMIILIQILPILGSLVLGILAWMQRDLHNALNSRLDEIKQAAREIGVGQGRDAMRKELTEDRQRDQRARDRLT